MAAVLLGDKEALQIGRVSGSEGGLFIHALFGFLNGFLANIIGENFDS
jgi:hypothetical protein